LAPLASFDSSRRAIGLANDERVTTLRLDSPFDYTKARLRIPKMVCAPEDVAGHTTEVARHIRVIAAGADGGVLVLFASAKQLRDVLDILGEDLRQHILVQGELPVREILLRNRSVLESGKRSIIFGLANFAEGIDLPGMLCTRVVITKIPFPSPDEPLIAAASEWIEHQGYKAFPLVMLPRGVIRFVQSVGRLMRSRSDWGEIIVLDKRLAEKDYGRRMRAAIPMKAVVV
jgi:ATP-dependent DNA helicase DinG